MSGPRDPLGRAWTSRALARSVFDHANPRAALRLNSARWIESIPTLGTLARFPIRLAPAEPAPLVSPGRWTPVIGPMAEHPLILAPVPAAAEQASEGGATAERAEQAPISGEDRSRERFAAPRPPRAGSAADGSREPADGLYVQADLVHAFADDVHRQANQLRPTAEPSTLGRLRRALQRSKSQDTERLAPTTGAPSPGPDVGPTPSGERVARASPAARGARIIEQPAEKQVSASEERPGVASPAQPLVTPAMRADQSSAGRLEERRAPPVEVPASEQRAQVLRAPDTFPQTRPPRPSAASSVQLPPGRPATPPAPATEMLPPAGEAEDEGEADLSAMRYTELSPDYEAEGWAAARARRYGEAGMESRTPDLASIEPYAAQGASPEPRAASEETQPPAPATIVRRLPEAAGPRSTGSQALVASAFPASERSDASTLNRSVWPGRAVEAHSQVTRAQQAVDARHASPTATGHRMADTMAPRPVELQSATPELQLAGTPSEPPRGEDEGARSVEGAPEQDSALLPGPTTANEAALSLGSATEPKRAGAADEESEVLEGTTILPLQSMPLEEAIFGPQESTAILPTHGAVIRRMTEETQFGSTASLAQPEQPIQAGSARAPTIQVNLVRRQAAPAPADREEGANVGSPSAETAAPGAPDVDQLAEEVYRRLRDRLRVERERYGAMRRP